LKDSAVAALENVRDQFIDGVVGQRGFHGHICKVNGEVPRKQPEAWDAMRPVRPVRPVAGPPVRLLGRVGDPLLPNPSVRR
jgi:hypothetical protein